MLRFFSIKIYKHMILKNKVKDTSSILLYLLHFTLLRNAMRYSNNLYFELCIIKNLKNSI